MVYEVDCRMKKTFTKLTTLSIVAVVIDNLEVNRRFVSSIRQYTKGRYELILIDNASRDRAAVRFFKQAADRYFRFDKIVSLARAWNKGIALSSGQYVAVVNNDVVVPPDWFAPLKETLDKHKNSGMISPITWWLAKGHYNYRLFDSLKGNFTRPYKLKRFKEIVWGEFMVFKRSTLETVGGFNEIYERASGEDLEMVFNLYHKGFDIYLDPRVFVYHEGRSSQVPSIISKRDREKYWRKNWKLFLSRWSEYTKGWK